MKFFNRKRFAKPLLALVVGLVALVGLQGCIRGYSHGRHTPERMEKRMDHVQEGISDFLEIRPLDASMDPSKIMETTGLTFRSIPECCQEFATRI